MTIAELRRAVLSRNRVRKLEMQEKANYDYTLAQLIGRACGMAFGTVKTQFPGLAEVYPLLFDSEEMKRKQQEKQAELSALRFKQFAESFNQRFNKEVAKN